MKVLQIADYIYPQISGIGVTAMDIAHALQGYAEKNHKNIKQKILCINHNVVKDGGRLDVKKNIQDEVEGVEVIRCKMDLHIASQPISASYIGILGQIMNRFQPDFVIFHYPNPYLAHFLLRYKKRSFKFVLWWHSDIIRQKLLGQLFINQNLELLRRAERVVATSQQYINGSKYLYRYKHKCTVISSCVREKELVVSEADKRKAEKLKPDNKIMCFSMGRHVPYKGLEYLIKAGKYLDGRFEFHIGSSGPLTKKLMRKTAGDFRFHFTGHLSKEDLRSYYYACDIFCFPSITRNEAFGLSLADAMYYGKPAVTFTIPGSGVNFVNLDGVTGIECENGNSREYARAIKRLANDEELRKRMGYNARKRAEEYFTFEKFEKAIIALIETLI